ncbi:CDP-glycerol glycerophosphotransferase family protein [Planktomarina sp.]|nr:hypothetical protein [Planktomarina sp.]MDB4841052.1 CDP-glycerol glycerophosphotransferase family protein [Planktomarina sp.]
MLIIELFKLLWIQIIYHKTLVIFRIENIGQLDIIYSDAEIFKKSGYDVIILTRDPEKFDPTFLVFQSRLYIFIFQCLLYVAVSQNMRAPFLLSTEKIFLLPYGYFAKGISLLRYRRKNYRNILVYNKAMKSYIKEFDPNIKSYTISYPKTRRTTISKRRVDKNLLIAPSYDDFTSLNSEAITSIVEHADLQEYSFTLKSHPRYFNKSDPAYKNRLDVMSGKLNVITKFDNLNSFENYDTLVTDYSSIAYEGLNLGLKVILYWSPNFYITGLNAFGVTSRLAYLRDYRVNSGFHILPKIRNANELPFAIKDYGRKMNQGKAQKFLHDISNGEPEYNSVLEVLEENRFV